MARDANGYLVTKPRLPPREGCRNRDFFSEERGGVLLEWKGAVLGRGVDRGVVSISQKHQAWLQRLQDWRWWRTFCSSSNLGFLLELGDRYFFFSPGSRGGKSV